MINFASRCDKQLEVNKVDSPAKLAPKIHDGDRGTRERVFAAFRTLQSAGALYWGSETSGLLKVCCVVWSGVV